MLYHAWIEMQILKKKNENENQKRHKNTLNFCFTMKNMK